MIHFSYSNPTQIDPFTLIAKSWNQNPKPGIISSISGCEIQGKLQIVISGYSCNLLTNEMQEVFPISTEEKSEIEAELNKAKNTIIPAREKNPEAEFGLVITGGSLTFALAEFRELFLEVSKLCQSVICCRVTPLQKEMSKNLNF